MSKLKELLEYLEENLDPEHQQKVEQRYKDAISFRAEKPPLILGYTDTGFSGYPYAEAHEDMEKMLYNELCTCVVPAQIKDDTLPMIRANYGVGTLPSLFGVTSRILGNNLPWVDHLESTDKIKALVGKGIPDLDSGFGKKISETHEYYRQTLSKYPNCERCIKIYHPDLQGPFDVAHLIWGPDIYYALYDEAELVHELLELITQTYIKFCEKIKPEINDSTGDGYCYHWSTLYPGEIVLRNDSAVNLSNDMYHEFIRPYDEKILNHFGGGSMHFCGRADQWVSDMAKTNNLLGFNFGYMKKLEFGQKYLDYLENTANVKLPILKYILTFEEFEQFDFEKNSRGVTFAVGVKTRKEAQDTLKKYYE